MSKELTEVIRASHSAVTREDWGKAWSLLNAALNDDPDRPESLYLMGATLRASGNLGLAYQVLRRALAQEQRQVNLWMVFAATLHDLNRWDEARDAMMVAHKLVPDDPMPLANIGATHLQQGHWNEALNWCNKAMAIDPDCHVARITSNFGYLSLGRWKDAWRDAEYLYGKHLPIRVYNPPEHEEPMWDGRKGQIVVVQADQGVGDIIMFSQCLREMVKDCREVILEVAPRLAGMFSRNFPEVTIAPTLKSERQYWAQERIGTERQINAHVHISFLGKFYRNRDKDFPRDAYLTANDKKVAEWREWLEQFPKPWVGIAWQGGIQATQAHIRSMDLEDMAPVIKSGGTMIDLSYQDTHIEVSRWNIDHPEQIIRPPINTEDFDNTVALIAALDDVVTVTTTVAHVCGALGKKAYVLTPSVPQWRYAYRCGDGKSLIWYPQNSVRLVRQANGETDWGPAVKRAAEYVRAGRQ